MAENTANSGPEGAHRAAKTGGGAPASVEAEQIAQVLAILDGPQQPALPLQGPVDDLDAVAKAAETLNAKRRARGRPEGSANRRNAEVFDYLEARGFKAPEVRLMELVSADPLELAKALAGGVTMDFAAVLEIVKLQVKAAAELMPYKYAKRHELKVDKVETKRHLFIAGRLTDGVPQQMGGFRLDGGLSNDINEGAVRDKIKVSHENRN